MALTIIDIAKLSGLSKSTVSRYLNQGSVSKKAAEKIQAVINENHFQTNIFASKLKSNKSMLIGLVIRPLRSLGSMTILQGITQQLADYQYSLLTVFEDFNQTDFISSFKHLESQGVDGIIYVNDAPSRDIHDYIAMTSLPIIHIGQSDDAVQPYMRTNHDVGFLLGKHISETGAQKVAYLSLPTEQSNGALERQTGFNQALEGYEIAQFELNYSSQAAYEMAKDIFGTKPDMIACASDRFVLGLLKYCNENDIQIPEDVKISSIGNYDFTEEFAMSITSIEIDYYTVGRQIAAEMLEKLGVEVTEPVANPEPILHVRHSSS